MTVTSFGVTTRKARRDHPCYWCRELILKNSHYSEWRGVDDGRAYTVRMHMICTAALQAAEEYNVPINEEPACYNTDVNGGMHDYGQRCAECSDMALRP